MSQTSATRNANDHIETVDGEVTAISNIRQLRLLARRRVNVPVLVLSDRGQFSSTLRNVSRGGAGLLINGQIPVGEMIEIHLAAGSPLAATVRWKKLGFCGVEFERPLACDDALLGDAGPRRVCADKVSQSASAGQDNAIAAVRRVPFLSSAFSARRKLIGILMQFRNHVSAASIRRRLLRNALMIESACRKQGYSWLIDE